MPDTGSTKHRKTSPKHTQDLTALKRLLRAYAWQVGSDEVLPGLLELRSELTALISDRVAWLRAAEGGAHSWAEIGAAAGISRQAAQERWAGAGGARRAGGQPLGLR